MTPGLDTFEIQLDSPDHTFSPGEIIAGRVIVGFKRPKSIRGLKVTIKGNAEVRWSKFTGSGKDRKMTQYTGDEEYFRMDFYALGRDGNSENIEIQTGNHVFPFNFCLPHNIPSSFETSHGNIRYTIKAVMERPWKFNHEKSIAFTVETPFDLSQCATAMTAIDDEEHDTFCCFPCFNMGAMKVHIFVPKNGYAIGEAIEAKININNSSTSVDVTKIKLRLEQKIKLQSHFPHSATKTHIATVQKVKKPGPFDKRDEILVSMQVPSLPCSNMAYCSLIDIEYNLRVIISVSGCHCATDKSYPIVIGTKPASSVQTVENPTMIPAPIPTAPFFPVDSAIPYPPPHGKQLSGIAGNEYNAPAPGFSYLLPINGFAPGNQPYPPAMPVPVGFVTPNPAQASTSIGFTEKPPPSYNEAMGTNE